MTAEPSGTERAASLTDRPIRRTGFAAVELDGETVILDDCGDVHLLNTTASLVWSCFDGQGSLAEIAADVADAFGVPLEAVQREVIALADDLATRRLLLLHPGEEDQPEPQPASEESGTVIVQPGGY